MPKNPNHPGRWRAEIVAACQNDDLEKAENLWNQAKIDNCQFDPDVYRQIIACAVENKKFSIAERSLQEAEENQQIIIYSYNTLLNGYVNNKQLPKALELLNRIKTPKNQKLGIKPDIFTYAPLLKGAAKFGPLNLGKDLWSQLTHAGIQPNSAAYNPMIELYGKERAVPEAMQLFEEAKRHKQINPQTYTTIIKVYAENGLLTKELAFALLKDMKANDILPNRITYNALITGATEQGERGDLKLAELLWKKAGEALIQFEARLYSDIIKCAGKHGTVSIAEQYFREAETNKQLDIQLCTTLINVYVDNQQLGNAWALWNKLETYNMRPNAITYSIMLKGAAHAGDVKRAETFWGKLKQPNTINYTHMIQVYVKTGDLKKARERLEEAAKNKCLDIKACNTLLSIAPSTAVVEFLYAELEKTKLTPNAITYTSIIQIYGKAGELAQAKIYLEKARQHKQIDAYLYTVMMKAYIENNQFPNAFNLLAEMKTDGITPTHVTYDVLIMGAITSSEKDNLALAKRLWEEAEEACLPFNPHLYNAMIECAGKNHNIPSAEEYFKKAEEKNLLDIGIFNTLINAYVENSQLETAWVLLGTLKTPETQATLGIKPNIITYNTLIKGAINYGERGNLKLTNALWKELNDAGLQPDAITYTYMIQIAGKTGDLTTAKEYLDAAKKNHQDDIKMHNAMMAAYVKEGELDQAQKFLKNLQEATDFNIKPNISTYNTLIDGYVKSGQLDRARKLKDAIPSNIKRDINTYNTLIDGAVQSCDPTLVVELLQEARELGILPDIVTYNTQLKLSAQRYDLNEAIKLFREAVVTHGIKPNIVTYNTLINLGVEIGDSKFVEEIRELATADRNVKFNLVTYNTLIKGAVRKGDFNAAQDWRCEISEKNLTPDIITFDLLIYGAAKKNVLDRVHQWVGDARRSNISLPNSGYQDLLELAVKNKDINQIKDFLKEVKAAGKFDEETYKLLAKNLLEIEEMDKDLAKAWLEEANLVTEKPNIYVYNNMLMFARKVNDLEWAQHLFSDVRLSKPNKYTYAILADIAVKNDKLDFLRTIVTQAQADNVDDIVLYTTLIKGCVTLGDNFDAAQQWINIAKTRGFEPNAVTFHTLIYQAVKKNKIAWAQTWLTEAKNSHAISWDSDAYDPLIANLNLIRNNPEAISLREKLIALQAEARIQEKISAATLPPEDPAAPHAHAILTAIDTGGLFAGKQLLDKVKAKNIQFAPETSILLFNNLCVAAAKEHNLYQAKQFVEESKQRNIPLSDSTYRQLINAAMDENNPYLTKEWQQRWEEAKNSESEQQATNSGIIPEIFSHPETVLPVKQQLLFMLDEPDQSLQLILNDSDKQLLSMLNQLTKKLEKQRVESQEKSENRQPFKPYAAAASNGIFSGAIRCSDLKQTMTKIELDHARRENALKDSMIVSSNTSPLSIFTRSGEEEVKLSTHNPKILGLF